MIDSFKILWVDDEVETLKPLIKFLEHKGYTCVSISNGYDAIEEFEQKKNFDAVFLDESMPGMGGLEVLASLKEIDPDIPVVMITKNEEEHIMEEAIGSQIFDYLIKPVNPSQVLLSLKRIVDEKRLIQEKTSSNYQQEFRKIFLEISDNPNLEGWLSIYSNLVNWEIKLDKVDSEKMTEILGMQKQQANTDFAKFVTRNYEAWVNDSSSDAPVMSHNVLRHNVFNNLSFEKPNILLLLDNMRLDQWRTIRPFFLELFKLEEEHTFLSILPTATQYSRNSIFAGLLPYDIENKYPDKWVNDSEEGGKNLNEEFLLKENIQRVIGKPLKMEYFKVTNTTLGKQLHDSALNFLKHDLSVVVYNFMDMLSHSRTEMDVLKELAGDEKAYRSLTKSWFQNSPLYQFLRIIAEKELNLFILTDHGSIRVKNPIKVLGDRETTSNLRYKVGKNLQYDSNEVLFYRDPTKVFLPKPNLSSSFIFAKEASYFLYPNNYNYYMNFFKDTFQHGGVSLEEIICPIVFMSSK